MEYRRQYRDLPDEVKEKISASTKGRAKSYDHKQHISQGMKKYCSSVPNKLPNCVILTLKNASPGVGEALHLIILC
jgi:hypothetical protein